MNQLNLGSIGLEELDHNEVMKTDGGIAPLIVAILIIGGLILSEQNAY